MTTLRIDRRFRGPRESGNGGYTCGLLAELLDAETAEVTLRLPPPLDRPLRVRRDGEGVHVLDGDALVAEARPAELELELPEPVSFADAERASAPVQEDPEHPFPDCFVCGPGRAAGDALRLRPGRVGGNRVAAPWRPAADHAGDPKLVWAALDCPGAYAVEPDNWRGVTVLGRLTARVLRTPEPEERCVVVGWKLGEDGRKLYAGTAVFGERGDPLGYGSAVWIALPPGTLTA